MQKTYQKEFRIQKVIKRKGDKLHVKSKGYNNSFNCWIDKKYIVSMSEYFPKTKYLKANVNFICLIYETKADLKNETGFDISDFAKKTDLANLKPDADKLDIDKLKSVPSNSSNLKSKVDKLVIGNLETTAVDLSKLSNVVKVILLKRLNIMS